MFGWHGAGCGMCRHVQTQCAPDSDNTYHLLDDDRVPASTPKPVGPTLAAYNTHETHILWIRIRFSDLSHGQISTIPRAKRLGRHRTG
jgi:hypothetical protein